MSNNISSDQWETKEMCDRVVLETSGKLKFSPTAKRIKKHLIKMLKIILIP